MLKIEGTTITLTRGDTMRVICQPVNTDGTNYVAQNGDAIRFAMKKRYSDNAPLLEKSIPTDTFLLELDPADTKTLAFGTYVYDVELTHADGDVDTYIAEASFVLAKEVH